VAEAGDRGLARWPNSRLTEVDGMIVAVTRNEEGPGR